MNVVKWTYVWIIILVHGLSASDLSIAQIRATGRVLFRELRDSDCKIKCSNKQRRPVCGSDGITYASKCELMKTKRCDKRNISIQKKGKCSGSRGTTKCQQERSEAQKIARRPSAGIFIPECKQDGAYMEVQCHAATSFCWCVTKEGRPISGTSLQGKKPSCKGKTRSKKSFRAKDRLRKKKRACTHSDRNEFNKNLLQTFIKEYERAMSLSSSSSNLKKKRDDSANNSRNKRVAEWKFSELDKNKDNQLRRKEVRTLKRMVKKVIKPRACAKTFISYCDFDQNKRIEREEWTPCLGVDRDSPWGRGRTKVDTQDQSRKRPKDPPPVIEENHNSLIDKLPGNSKIWPPKGLIPHQPSNTPPPDTDDKSRSCIEEREAALKQNRQDPTGGTFIPSCTNTGQWSQAQCHNSSGYCWCVEESTGHPIPGIPTYLKVLPKCDVVKIQRKMKGCPFSKKRRFLSNLLQYIIKQMNTSNPLNVLNVGGSVDTSPEAAVEWKFRNLDSNSNLVLERKELKKLRKEIPQTKDTRRCRRNFIRYCDENKDRKVSKKEWIDCMDTSGSAALPLPDDPRRRGPNPFSKYLSPN